MSKILVTGGSGFLGEHLVATLRERGQAVRVLVRGTYEPNFGEGKSGKALGALELLRGDVVEDSPHSVTLAHALRGVDEVYHLAGMVSRELDAQSAMMRVHVEGTKRLLVAAKEAGVRRVVIASSSGTVAVSRDAEPIPTEDWPYATEIVSGWPYYLSKIYQEKVAFDLGATLGLEIVVVNPSLLLGPGDRRQSSTGDVLKLLRRQVPVMPSGGVSFVDARDAATATVAAMDRGRAGQRYLMGAANWDFATFFGRLSRLAKVPAPWLKLPDKLMRRGATVIEELYRTWDRAAPVDRISVEMSQVFWYCDSSRAERELGFDPRDPAETLDETIRDLKRRYRI